MSEDAQQSGDRADRAIKTYAYLTASFRAKSDVVDLLDCLVPFIAAVALKDPDRPIIIADVATGIEQYGLSVPLYALSQLLPRLAKKGLVEWSPIAKAYIPVKDRLSAASAQENLTEDFNSLEAAIAAFAHEKHRLSSPPFSPSWNDALINFLKSERVKTGLKSVVIHRAIVSDFANLESYVVARFIQTCFAVAKDTFDKIERVYTGVLIEDFIGNVQSIGSERDFKGLSVYYDTPVLLRLLGASGKLLETATLEMHNNLRDLGCDLYYFDVNRAESENILNTIVAALNNGHELYGETAEAILDGDIDPAFIRDLVSTFDVRLGQLNVFPYDYNYTSRKNEDAFQIDEPAFATALESAALAKDRSYKRENANNDAKAVALVWRLRKGRLSRDLANSHHIFISRNSLLQRVAKSYGRDHIDYYDASTSPPVLTLGQITTAGWLATKQPLEAHKVSQELLASCYAAVKPSAGWADEYARAFGDLNAEDKDSVLARADAHLILKILRETARDESLNEPAILKRLSLTDIFRDAQAQADQAKQQSLADIVRLQEQGESRLEQALSAAAAAHAADAARLVTEATERERLAVRQHTLDSIRSKNRARAEKAAGAIVRVAQLGVTIAIVAVVIFADGDLLADGSVWKRVFLTAGIVIGIIGALDLTGLAPVKQALDAVRSGLAKRIGHLLNDDAPF